MNNQYYVSKKDFIEHNLFTKKNYIFGLYFDNHLRLEKDAKWFHEVICAFLGGAEGIVTYDDMKLYLDGTMSDKKASRLLNLLKKHNIYEVTYQKDPNAPNSYKRRYIKCNICAEPWKVSVPLHIKKDIITNRIIIIEKQYEHYTKNFLLV